MGESRERQSDGEAIPQVIGPYRITGVLGKGGMGVVYRGEHLKTGEPAAVKTLYRVGATLLASLRREIHALRRVHHPGVVQIVAEGISGGLPWYAMEFLEGSTLRDHLDRLASQDRDGAATNMTTGMVDSATETMPVTSPGIDAPPDALPERSPSPRRDLPSAELLGILRRLCAPLSFLHGSGLVHRDLKPENVFVRADGTPVLVDLGLAACFSGARGREELEPTGAVMGSARYMAPEQIRGEMVDARADLYALGCILYECITGAPPFVGRDVATLLRAHLWDQPVPPSHRARGVPAEIDRLVLELLEKQPQDRLGYADDVAAVLAELGVKDDARTAVTGGGQPYLYRPVLVGRDAALRELTSAITRASALRGGGRIYLGGESGVGKTRLAMEALGVATRRGLAVALGQCVALGVGVRMDADVNNAPLHPFAPFLLAVADRCRERGVEETARLLGARGKLLAAYQPALADLPGQEELPDPVPLEPQAARARALAALAATLFAFAEERSLFLVLDDLQWADELTASFLRDLSATELETRGVLIVGTYRMEEMSRTLEGIVGAPGARRLDLGRLGEPAVGAMVRGMLALREPPAELVEFLDRQCDGNPFFIAEYLRTAIDEGLLTRDRAGQWRLGRRGQILGPLGEKLPLPRTLAELIERRLLDLGEAGRALVHAAAVLGREFEGDLLLAATPLDGAEGMDALATLHLRQIVEEGDVGRLRFVHDKIREIAYERIPEGERRLLHRRAGETIEARGGDVPGLYPVLAHHASMAEVHDKASHYFTLAADRARAAYANGDAIALYRSAINETREVLRASVEPEGKWLDSLAPLHESLGDLLALTGQQQSARSAYEEALTRASGGERLGRARIHRKIGKTWDTHHQDENTLRCYAAAEACLGEEPAADPRPKDPPAPSPGSPSGLAAAWWHEWIQIQIDKILFYYWVADVAEMTALARRIPRAVELHGTPAQRTQLNQMLARVNFRRERYRLSDETLHFARVALAASEESGDMSILAESRYFWAFTLLFHGSLDEAEKQMRAALESVERTGDLTLHARCLAYLLITLRMRGDVGEVQRFGQGTLKVSTEGQIFEYMGVAKANMSWVAYRRGDLAQVEPSGREALALWQRTSFIYPFHWLARFPLAVVKLAGGFVDEAIDHARAMLHPAQHRLPDELVAILEQCINAWNDGRGDAASAHFDEAVLMAKRLGYL